MSYPNEPKSTAQENVSMAPFHAYANKQGASVEPTKKAKAPVLTSAPNQLGHGKGSMTGTQPIGKLPGLPGGNLG